MTISDKTRKILWGHSGNRCAFCRTSLMVDATPEDNDSVVGDECHIISGKPGGPRADPAFHRELLDEPDNLLLLCRVHHKMVDDQSETYTADVLKTIRTNHQRWVSSVLAEDGKIPPVRIRRVKDNIPSHLIRLMSGSDVFKIVDRASGYLFDHDDLRSESEVDLVGGFLQEARDWGEISDDLEAADRVRATFDLTNSLRILDEAGFWVFGATETRRLEGGVAAPSSFPVAILRVIRSDDPSIIKIDVHPSEHLESAECHHTDTPRRQDV
ncbi:HNH endonuclease [Sorangium sp. So ce124]|uniref:HNH endonuclease n=1 Tax=Sorangium sp. So ce124 TaxID=3133280 RepID=UPI003F6317EA